MNYVLLRKTMVKYIDCISFFRTLFFFLLGLNSLSSASLSPVMSSSTQEITHFLTQDQGSSQAKLVFINYSISDSSKKLCYIDFSEPLDSPRVHTIDAAVDAQLPVISPDGNWVVYATGKSPEAGGKIQDDSGSVYICQLSENATPVLIQAHHAHEPRFEQNIPNNDQLSVIYATNSPDSAWTRGKTMKVSIDISSQTPVVGTPQVLFEHGSYTGGLSRNNKMLCGGYPEIVMVDITSGATQPNIVSYCSQSCNASIASSFVFTSTMMHLTMGGSHPNINSGKKWQTWQVILINDSQGNILKGFWYPTEYKFSLSTTPETFSGKARWHHCEWSNHPYFATATLNVDRFFKIGSEYQNTKYHERLYLLNLKDSSYIEILRPDTILYEGIPDDYSGFLWPWLWVKIPDSFQEDSVWLISTTSINSNSTTLHGSSKNSCSKMLNNILYTQKKITSLKLYTPHGKLLYTQKPCNTATTAAIDGFNQLGDGVYFIRIEYHDKTKEVISFTKD